MSCGRCGGVREGGGGAGGVDRAGGPCRPGAGLGDVGGRADFTTVARGPQGSHS